MLVRVSARFELVRVRVIGIRLKLFLHTISFSLVTETLLIRAVAAHEIRHRLERGERNSLGKREKRPINNREEGERKRKIREMGEPG